QQRGADRVGVEDRADFGSLRGDDAVQERFGARLRLPRAGRPSRRVDPDEVAGGELLLVLAARRDDQLERIARDDDAVIAAGPERPAAAMELRAAFAQPLNGRLMAVQRMSGREEEV